MREAVIVSTARTPIGKAFRGAFNNTHGATLAGHAIEQAVARSGLAPGEIEDVIVGCGLIGCEFTNDLINGGQKWTIK